MPQRRAATAELDHVIRLIDAHRERPTIQLLEAIESRLLTAMTLLRTPDNEQKRVAFILLAIQQSTQVRTYTRNGKNINRVNVIDLQLYNWGMEKLHALAIAP